MWFTFSFCDISVKWGKRGKIAWRHLWKTPKHHRKGVHGSKSPPRRPSVYADAPSEPRIDHIYDPYNDGSNSRPKITLWPDSQSLSLSMCRFPISHTKNRSSRNKGGKYDDHSFILCSDCLFEILNIFRTCHLDLPLKPVIRICQDLPFGLDIWACHYDLPLRPAIRTCHWDLPLGPAIGTCH